MRWLFRRAEVCGGHKRVRPVVPLLQYLDHDVQNLRLCAAAARDPALSPRTLTLASDHHPACHFVCSGTASLNTCVIDLFADLCDLFRYTALYLKRSHPRAISLTIKTQAKLMLHSSDKTSVNIRYVQLLLPQRQMQLVAIAKWVT